MKNTYKIGDIVIPTNRYSMGVNMSDIQLMVIADSIDNINLHTATYVRVKVIKGIARHNSGNPWSTDTFNVCICDIALLQSALVADDYEIY